MVEHSARRHGRESSGSRFRYIDRRSRDLGTRVHGSGRSFRAHLHGRRGHVRAIFDHPSTGLLSLLTCPAVLSQNACGSVQHVRQDLTTKLGRQ